MEHYILQLGFTDYAQFLKIAHILFKILVILTIAFILLKVTSKLIKKS